MTIIYENMPKRSMGLTNVAKVENFKSFRSGNPIANQFRITLQNGAEVFQSYNSIVAVKVDGITFLDRTCWDYSNTTSRYRKEFLNEDTKTTKQKIKDDVYILMNLN
jgi:hypothetical protein